MAIPNPERTFDAEEEFSAPEETSQKWLLRHLRRELDDVHDGIINEFLLEQDITAFRNFMTNVQTRKCIFVTVERRRRAADRQTHFFETVPTAEELKPTETAEIPIPIPILPKETTKKMKPKRKNSQKRKDQTKEPQKQTKKKTNEEEVPKTEPEPTVPKPVPVPIELQFGPEVIDVYLQWETKRQIPTESSEFLFVVSRDEPNTGVQSEFDRIFVVGHCRNVERFRNIIDVGLFFLLIFWILKASMILGDRLDFERNVDLLLQSELGSTERREKWQNPTDRFENFIADSLIYSFQSNQKRNQIDSNIDNDEVDVESIESRKFSTSEMGFAVLRSRVRAFSRSPSPNALTQIRLELSLYEIKFLSGEIFSHRAVDRLQRLVILFSVIEMLYFKTNGEWIQKALFHCVELTARIIATNMHQRVWNLVYEDCEGDRKISGISDEEHQELMNTVKPSLMSLINLGLNSFPQLTDEYTCLEKIEQCVKIIDFIQEEFQKLKNSVENFHDRRRDATFDRRPLLEVKALVRTVWSTFDESALESGNYDTLKNVCLCLSDLNTRIVDALPKLDQFCRKN